MAEATVTGYMANIKDTPYPFLAIGIGYETPVRIGKVEGKVVGFDGEYTAICEFPCGTIKVEMEAFL